MSGVFPVVKGIRLRATKINRCGLPIPGPKNRIITDGFITADLTPVMRDAQELEQANAEGKICVAERTPPTRKWYTVELNLCNVNSGLISLLNGWPQVLGYDDTPIGFQDKADVDGDYGTMLEIWTGGKSDDDCPTPTLDTIFSAPTSGRQYGYFLFGGVEFTLGPINIGEVVSTFTLSGITVATPQWGRGPYNVAGTDAVGTPGRLLVPVGKDPHLTVFRTPVAPPEVTTGGEPQALDILGKFVDPAFYFGGPANEPAADVAPGQDEASYDVAVTGGPTSGTFTLIYTDGGGTAATTAPIEFDALPADVESALAALSNLEPAEVDVSGTAPAWTAVFVNGGTLAKGTTSFVGGTTPDVTVVVTP